MTTAASIKKAPGLSPFLDRLKGSVGLSAESEAALLAIIQPFQTFEKGAVIQHEGDACGSIFILCGGMALASKQMSDGNQQNVGLFVAGDMLNGGCFILRTAGVTLSATTAIAVASIETGTLVALIERRGDLCLALWRMMAVTNSVAQEWIVGLGRRTAYSRVAHFFCEIFVRCRTVGLAIDERSCDFRLTQSELSDTIGLSVVHTNRVLKQLRGDGLVDLRGGRLTILDWEGLAAAGDFEAGYLM